MSDPGVGSERVPLYIISSLLRLGAQSSWNPDGFLHDNRIRQSTEVIPISLSDIAYAYCL